MSYINRVRAGLPSRWPARSHTRWHRRWGKPGHVGAHAAGDGLVGLGNLVLATAHELVRARVLAVLVPVHEAIARAGVRDAPRRRVVRVVPKLGTSGGSDCAKGHRAAQRPVASCRSTKVLTNDSALVVVTVELAR